MSQNGRAANIYGETEFDAKRRAMEFINFKQKYADSAAVVAPRQLAECAKAIELLGPHGISPLEAVASTFLPMQEGANFEKEGGKTVFALRNNNVGGMITATIELSQPF